MTCNKAIAEANQAISWFDKKLGEFTSTENKVWFIESELKRNEGYLKKYEGAEIHWLNFEQNIIDVEGFQIYKNHVIEKSKLFIPSDEFQFKSIFDHNGNGYQTCIDLMEELEITIDGKNNVSPGRTGKLIGVIIALKNTPGIFRAEFTEQKLLNYFNLYLGTNFKVVSKRGEIYREYLDLATRILKMKSKK